MQHFFVDNCRQSETKSRCNICGKAILMLCWKQMHFKCQCSVSGCPMRAPCQPGKDILDQWTRLDLNTNKHATWQIQGKHHKFWWKQAVNPGSVFFTDSCFSHQGTNSSRDVSWAESCMLAIFSSMTWRSSAQYPRSFSSSVPYFALRLTMPLPQNATTGPSPQDLRSPVRLTRHGTLCA